MCPASVKSHSQSYLVGYCSLTWFKMDHMLAYEPVKEFQFCNTIWLIRALSTCILKFSRKTKTCKIFVLHLEKKKSAFKDRLVAFNWGRGKACVVSGISPDIQVKVSAHQKYNRFSVTYLLWLCSRLFFPVMLLISRSASVLVHVISNTASITTTSQYLLVAHYATWPTVVKCLCSVSLLRGGGVFSRVISFRFYF